MRRVVERGPAMIDALLLKYGADFDVDADDRGGAELDLGREGGHSHRRILHHRDATGREIERVLLARARAHPNASSCSRTTAVDLDHLTAARAASGPNACARRLRARRETRRGPALPRGSRCSRPAAPARSTSTPRNPDIASGDGMAMAYRAGATLANMEFVQFHPTCLFHPRPSRS